MKNKNLFIVIGQLSLAVSIILNHFVKENEFVSFLIGLFTGLSIVFNFAFLLNRKKLETQAVNE